jgi:hypothetical protein
MAKVLWFYSQRGTRFFFLSTMTQPTWAHQPPFQYVPGPFLPSRGKVVGASEGSHLATITGTIIFVVLVGSAEKHCCALNSFNIYKTVVYTGSI